MRDGVVGYDDSNYAEDLDKRSLTDYMFIIGGCAINWTTTLQIKVMLLTTKFEYKFITEALRKLLG